MEISEYPRFRRLTGKDRTYVKTFKEYVAAKAIQYMRDNMNILDDEPREYECSECYATTLYSHGLDDNYPFPKCLEECCLIKYLNI